MNSGTAARWRSYLTGAGAVALTFALGAAVVMADAWKRELSVLTVRCEGNQTVPTAELLRLAAVPRGGRLYAVDLEGVRNRLRQHPYVRSAVVTRDPPSSVALVIEERQPVAALPQGGLVYLDGEGVVLPAIASAVSFDLPMVTGNVATAEPGKRMNDVSVQEALQLLLTAQSSNDETYRRISEVHIREDRELLLYTTEGGVPVVFGRGEAAMKIAKFDAFWNTIVRQRAASDLQYVDLRFQNQVIARWNGN